jgi:hypothetical protein
VNPLSPQSKFVEENAPNQACLQLAPYKNRYGTQENAPKELVGGREQKFYLNSKHDFIKIHNFLRGVLKNFKQVSSLY